MADPHINPQTGVWDDNYFAQNQSKSSGGSSGGDIASIAQQQLKMYQDANAPAINSLQSSIPEIGKKYQLQSEQLTAQRKPLEDRYKNLLDQVTSSQRAEEQRTGIATSRELGRRGISADSGLYDQTVNEKLSPVTQFYTGQAKDIGITQEQNMSELNNLIANLAPQQTADERQVLNAIAQLQAGAGGNAISSAMQIYNQQQEQARQQQLIAAQQPANDLEMRIKQQALNTQTALDPIQIASAKTALNKAQQPNETTDIAGLLALLGGNVAGASTPKTTKPQVYGQSTNAGNVYYAY